MGWTSYHASHYNRVNGRDVVDVRAECDAYFVGGLNRGFYILKKSAMVGGVYYAAVERTDGKYGTFCAVILADVGERDYYNISIKVMSDDMGPAYYDCPASILALLSETDNEFALEWRARCREEVRKKKAHSALAKLPIGTRIRFEAGGRTFVAIKHKAAYQFKRPFWMNEESNTYFKRGTIPSNFVILEN